MEKDLFDFVIVPTKNEFRKKNCINKIYGIPKLNIHPSSLFINSKSYLINDAIANYNNEVFVAKVYFSYVEKYHRHYKKYNTEEYDFWTRKYIEQTIKELYSIYDKSMHIINYLYDFKIKSNSSFNKELLTSLKLYDIDFYKEFNSIFNQIYDKKYKNIIRNDITHNISTLFPRLIPIYKDKKETSWEKEEPITLDDGIEIIKDICTLLEKNKEILMNKLLEKFPQKETKEYEVNYKRYLEEWNKKIKSQ